MRDASGNVTFIDATFMNLFSHETQGVDLRMDCSFDTPIGSFALWAARTNLLHLKSRDGGPEFESRVLLSGVRHVSAACDAAV